jgi:hypothetical protein
MLSKDAHKQNKSPISRIAIRKADEWEFALTIPSRAGAREIRRLLAPMLQNRDTIMQWARESRDTLVDLHFFPFDRPEASSDAFTRDSFFW